MNQKREVMFTHPKSSKKTLKKHPAIVKIINHFNLLYPGLKNEPVVDIKFEYIDEELLRYRGNYYPPQRKAKAKVCHPTTKLDGEFYSMVFALGADKDGKKNAKILRKHKTRIRSFVVRDLLSFGGFAYSTTEEINSVVKASSYTWYDNHGSYIEQDIFIVLYQVKEINILRNWLIEMDHFFNDYCCIASDDARAVPYRPEDIGYSILMKQAEDFRRSFKI